MSPKEPILALLVAGAAGGGLWAAAFGMGYRAAPALCVVVGLTVGLSFHLAWQLVPPPEPLPVPPSDGSPDESRDEGLLPLASLESRLSWGGTDPDRFRHRVRPELLALTADLLRTRRGIDLRTEPDRARNILGEPLWQLITRTPTRSPSRAELSRLVDALERI
jgi:hypothetical protein